MKTTEIDIDQDLLRKASRKRWAPTRSKVPWNGAFAPSLSIANFKTLLTRWAQSLSI